MQNETCNGNTQGTGNGIMWSLHLWFVLCMPVVATRSNLTKKYDECVIVS